LYKKEQEEIVDKIIEILDLENNNIINLCDLDEDNDKQKQIMELIPEIRKYYSFNGIKAVGEPNKIKRPWLSIIKHLTKEKYKLESKEYRFFDEKENKYLRTQKYIFTKLNLNWWINIIYFIFNFIYVGFGSDYYYKS